MWFKKGERLEGGMQEAWKKSRVGWSLGRGEVVRKAGKRAEGQMQGTSKESRAKPIVKRQI